MQRQVYRIFDANVNRLREGLRVVEEIARFVMNDGHLTVCVKEMRHKVAGILTNLPHLEQLLINRCSENDVGAGFSLDSEENRAGFHDVALANLKRCQEAARSLEEFTKIISSQVSQGFKELRFELYILEKNMMLALSSLAPGKWRGAGVNVIIGCTEIDGRTPHEILRQAAAGGAAAVQLREKNLPVREIIRIGQELRELARELKLPFIVNDHADIALVLDADGVHLGQNDLPIEAAKKLLGPDKIVGLSVNTPEQALAAAAAGANYIGVGPVFPTPSKADAAQPIGLAVLREVCRLIPVPVTAIGGVSRENIHQVADAGVAGVSVISAVTQAANITEATAFLASFFPQNKS